MSPFEAKLGWKALGLGPVYVPNMTALAIIRVFGIIWNRSRDCANSLAYSLDTGQILPDQDQSCVSARILV